MTMDSNWQYAIVWQFEVRPAFQAQFEKVYGPQGVWADFFRSASGYLGTELLRDETNPCRYVTIDLWRSRQHYDAFRQQHADEYHRSDERCEQMTEGEQSLGTYERVLPAP